MCIRDSIEDCYNANPDSMKAALAMFKEFPCKRRFALLGDICLLYTSRCG